MVCEDGWGAGVPGEGETCWGNRRSKFCLGPGTTLVLQETKVTPNQHHSVPP